MYKLFFLKTAAKELKKLEKGLQIEIKTKISLLQNNPKKGKPLKHSHMWTLRVQKYRIIYEIKLANKEIIILHILHRKNAYLDFSKIFSFLL